MDIAELAEPNSPLVQAALTRRCNICKAKPAVLCCNTIRPDQPLPGRLIHLERATG